MASQFLSQWIFLLKFRAWSLLFFLNCMLSFRMFGVKYFMNIFKFLFRVVFGGVVFSSFFFFSSTLDCSSDFVYRFMPLYFDAGNAIAFFLFLVPMYALRTLRYCQSLKSFMHNHVLIWIKEFGLILIYRTTLKRIMKKNKFTEQYLSGIPYLMTLLLSAAWYVFLFLGLWSVHGTFIKYFGL